MKTSYYYLPMLAPAVVAACIIQFRTASPELGARLAVHGEYPASSIECADRLGVRRANEEYARRGKGSRHMAAAFRREHPGLHEEAETGRHDLPRKAAPSLVGNHLGVTRLSVRRYGRRFRPNTDSDFRRRVRWRSVSTACCPRVRWSMPSTASPLYDLKPQPMRPGPEMCSMLHFWTHNRMIESQRDRRATGDLVSGHKKDLVLTNRLRREARPRGDLWMAPGKSSAHSEPEHGSRRPLRRLQPRCPARQHDRVG